MRTAFAAGAILATWLLSIAVATGIGLGLRQLANGGDWRRADPFGAFWVGLSGAVAFLQVWHLFFPVSGTAVLVLVLLGATGTLLAGPGRRRLASALSDQRRWIAAALLAGFWVADRALAVATAPDTGIYHAPVVAWLTSHPIVPGLANLHGRLGFNNANLLLAAALDQGPWARLSSHLANGLLLYALLAQVLWCAFEAARSPAEPRPVVFGLALLPAVVFLCLDSYHVASLTIDTAVAVLLWVAGSRLCGFVLRARPETPGGPIEATWELTVIGSLCATAVCFKLSNAACAALALGAAVAWWWRSSPGAARHARRPIVALAFTVLVLGAPWLVRGVVLSGYVAYPATAIGLPVDWKVPAEQVAAERAWIRFFATHYHSRSAFYGDPSDVTGPAGPAWIGPWIRALVDVPATRWQVTLPLMLSAGVLAWGGWRRRHGAAGESRIPLGWLLTPAGGGVIVWLLAAPRPVFGFALFWLGFAVCAEWALGSAIRRGRSTGQRVLALGVAGVLVPVAWSVGAVMLAGEVDPIRAAVRAVLVERPEEAGGWPVPAPPVRAHVTRHGLPLLVPERGKGCWYTAPLCTPHPAENLRLRRPGDVAGGLRTAGGWCPAQWPDRESRFLSAWRSTHGGAPPDCLT